MSHASAMSLDLMSGRMYRNAVNKCVNLLVHYPEGCAANCAYCGLAKKRPGTYQEKSFIHVDWPIYDLEKVSQVTNQAPAYVKRTCISMITNGKCVAHTLEITRRLRETTRLPISILVSPTLLNKNDLIAMQAAGADKIGIALDLANPELFDQWRGPGVGGPHRWEKYWQTIAEGLEVFGTGNVGAHLMVGMGETEEEMVKLMARLWQMGVSNHLFAFFAEEHSQMAERPQPPWPVYLRIQLALYLLEQGLVRIQDMAFDARRCLVQFGLQSEKLEEIINRGTPFMTTGCLGADGQVACNRPFGNCLPDEKQWNYPYPPNAEEIALIRAHIFEYGLMM
jgi:biotin synthase